jgi:hypothetical protein
MSVRLEVTEGGFAGAAVVRFYLFSIHYSVTVTDFVQPTPQSPLPPPQQLEELRNVLLATFKREFDAAAERKDEQEVSRYFRLWPGIGAEDEGLAAYGDFVVGLVKMRSAASSKREWRVKTIKTRVVEPD